MASSKQSFNAGIILAVLLFLAAGNTSLRAQSRKITVYDYIEQYKSVAIEEMLRSKIPASIIMAQGILESSNGNSALATEANNHFGIKCKTNWLGKTIMEDDDEKQECFRAYESVRDSYKDHSDFLMTSPRYAFLFDLGEKNYKDWAIGLREAGYATNPNYPRLLVDLIEKHKLNEYDDVKPTHVQKSEIKAREVQAQSSQIKFNGLPAVVAKEGDSYAKIAIDNGLMVNKLYKYNDLSKDAIPNAGDKVYLKQKAKKGKEEYHKVKNTETMFTIAQLHGIRLKGLLKMNRMAEGTHPAIGETVWLQNTRPRPPALRTIIVEAAETIIEVRMGERKAKTKDTTYTNTNKQKTVVRNTETTVVPRPDSTPVVVVAPASALPSYHTIKQGETLSAISRLYKISVAELIAMNNLKSDGIREGQKIRIAKSGEGSIALSSDPAPGDRPATHIVQRGETLSSISRLYKMSVQELISINKMQDPGIKAGQKLKVTATGQGQESGTIVTSEPSNNNKDSNRNSNSNNTAPANNENPGSHIVQKGETLYSISKKYGLTVKELTEINKITGEGVRAGQKLSVVKSADSGSGNRENNNSPDKVKTHTVVSGDTMYSICKKYSITEAELMRLNNLSNNVIRLGQTLKVSE